MKYEFQNFGLTVLTFLPFMEFRSFLERHVAVNLGNESIDTSAVQD